MGLRAAIRFLTIVPIRGGDAPPGQAAAFFPLVGAMLGAAGAGVFVLASRAFPTSIAALATVAFWIAISGVLHEDGLADVADAVRAGRSRERVFAILKDSRIGTYAAVAILLSVLARWRPAGSGLGAALASTLSTPAALVAIAQGVAAALLCGWRPGFAMIAGSVLIVQAARAWFYRRLGGVNGDCLGFTEQLLEVFVLVLFACRSCAW
jgi:adenosylcobinamide-GDP ribazoletransferase